MINYDFILKYRLSETDSEFDSIVERLGEAGCTDALVGVGIVGRIALDFTREADNARDAIRSAVLDVHKALPTATLVEITPDLVGLSDIADILDIARQNVRKAMVAHSDFPAPVHEGNPTVWRLSHVLDWCNGHSRKVPDHLYEVATAAAAVNLMLQASRLPHAKMYAVKRHEAPLIETDFLNVMENEYETENQYVAINAF